MIMIETNYGLEVRGYGY